MSGKIRVALAAMLICLLAVLPALAAGVFQFADKSVSLREGEIFQTALRREGVYDGDGEITYTSSKPGIASVSGDGTITAVTRGEAVVYANLMRNGKRVGRAQMSVKVIRPVTKVTLSTNGLAVYEPDDPTIAGLLREATEYRVIAVAAGATVNLSAVCTPTDASNRQVTFTTDDEGVARVVNNKALKAIQRGECTLTVASADSPEITETFRVLVTQPVKAVVIQTETTAVENGAILSLKRHHLGDPAGDRAGDQPGGDRGDDREVCPGEGNRSAGGRQYQNPDMDQLRREYRDGGRRQGHG